MQEGKEQTRSAIENDPRWQAVSHRDASLDGQFYYAVHSTGIYCRPSCPARKPKPEHVSFYPSALAAAQAGFRPCKRCKPDQILPQAPHMGLIMEACKLMEKNPDIQLPQLAAKLGISQFHFHRVFRAMTGVTPKQYATAIRLRRVKTGLQQGTNVTDAIYDAGFNTPGRFYVQAEGSLGMTPTSYKKGGMHKRIEYGMAECALGQMLVAATDKGISAILLGDNADTLLTELRSIFPHAELVWGNSGFEQLLAKVVELVVNPTQAVELPLDIQGTAFQQRVWQLLRAIPPGQTVSYSELAQQLGAPNAIRAVASACAANKLAVAIPCHRVLRSDGQLAGYRWGLQRKRALLDKESE
ncbi:bifunctional DNA-binding transcriptional regulator/O6-methylguanine-DNA methyltransferase Ada [Methylobacillus arboreus]|uniref:bifunctional DNA-binding transcriptional regulator/O6-methylguanine-DNA methyltransferase Ada n=1 Tax=Methylobacillus arboreus TaxID=755170 RepID=UPI001E4C6920|nr:bifunctional DNA-binding transcriptional regulator/O6-methylguanine-DNA methyltransferase Ada [Methylobacillus arboreus]MCB5189940.1 bifunctional DNA-binding transcriptional regulator/O6-methylguanine-DNA methyltransferase Ada [Methylobacillus arboreus]